MNVFKFLEIDLVFGGIFSGCLIMLIFFDIGIIVSSNIGMILGKKRIFVVNDCNSFFIFSYFSII